jgi:hypothetical protein
MNSDAGKYLLIGIILYLIDKIVDPGFLSKGKDGQQDGY